MNCLRFRRSILLLLFACLLQTAHGNSLARTNIPVLSAGADSSTIPFTLVGKLIIIQASADTSQGNFVLDTGSPGLVLNNTYFHDYPIIEVADGRQRNVTGDDDALHRTIIQKLRLGDMSYAHAEADLVNLGRLERNKGIKILGLLGVSLFTECELIIDYAHSLVHIHHISKKEIKTYQHQILSDTSAYSSFPLDMKDNRVKIKAHIANRDLHFAIDYAATSSILDSRLPESVSDSVSIEGRIILSGVGSRQVEAVSGTLSGLRVGNIDVPFLPVIITRLEYTCFGGVDCIDGVLGYDFLSRYTTVINFRKRILYIIK